jgi:predicted phosphodiesterase
MMKRRQFIKNLAGGSSILFLPISLKAVVGAGKSTLRFGVCADVHKDIMHDADERLSQFIKAASGKDLDFIVQMGDFCRPYDYNKDFLNIWNNYSGDKHHVIGNHEMDGGFSREQVLAFWDTPAKYYSFDKNAYHFIVLDGNDVNPSPNKASGYARFIGDEQLEWLKNDLKSTGLPCVIFSHQTLDDNADGIENREQIRILLENESKNAGFQKVVACFSGHHHTDYATSINGIYYIQINSMSYQWLGDDFKTVRYSKEIDKKYPWIKYTAPYKDPLFAFVEIDRKFIRIEGRKSEFIGPTPKDLGCPEPPKNNPLTPEISDKKLKL